MNAIPFEENKSAESIADKIEKVFKKLNFKSDN